MGSPFSAPLLGGSAKPRMACAGSGAEPRDARSARSQSNPNGYLTDEHGRRASAAGLTLSKNNSATEGSGTDPLPGGSSSRSLPLSGRSERFTGTVPGRLKLASVTACESNSWTLLYWQKGTERRDGSATGTYHARIGAAPYRCRSWRCRRCAWACARDDYRRIERAVVAKPWWLYCVLTFNPKDWRNQWECYRGVGELWDHRLRKRIQRQFGRFIYLQTWERQRSGLPHVNLLLTSDALRAHCATIPDRREWRQEVRHGQGRLCHWTAFRKWLAPVAVECGFGIRTWVEIVDSPRDVSAYLVKVADEISRATFKEGDQRPLGAPAHFRRIRASRGTLPAREKVVTVRHVDTETGEETRTLALRPADAPSSVTGVLAGLDLSTFDTREPTWNDVERAWVFQAWAQEKRAHRAARQPEFER